MSSAYAPGPQVAISDAHNDLLMLVTRRPPAGRGRYFKTRWLPQLRAGGVSLQVLPMFVDDEFRPELALPKDLGGTVLPAIITATQTTADSRRNARQDAR